MNMHLGQKSSVRFFLISWDKLHVLRVVAVPTREQPIVLTMDACQRGISKIEENGSYCMLPRDT